MARDIKSYKKPTDYVIDRKTMNRNLFLFTVRERRDKSSCVRCGHEYNDDEDMDWYCHIDHRTKDFLGDWCENCISETGFKDELEFFGIGNNIECDFAPSFYH